MPSLWLTSGREVLFSAEDVQLIAAHKWWEHVSKHTGNSYAYTTTSYVCPVLKVKRRRKIYMHRRITNCPAGYSVDHANRRTLDNRRPNLRITTGTFQNANKELQRSLSGFRGVTMHRGGWRARITFQGDDIHIGVYRTRMEAAQAYDIRAAQLFGPFAWLNFPGAPVTEQVTEQDEPDPAGFEAHWFLQPPAGDRALADLHECPF